MSPQLSCWLWSLNWATHFGSIKHFLLNTTNHTSSLLRVSSQGVPSPTQFDNFQHGGKVPTFEPQETFKIWLLIINIGSGVIYAKIFAGIVFMIGPCFLLDPTLNTNPKPHFQKVLPSRHPCHTWNSMWSGKSQLACSQSLRLHGLTSSALRLRTWDVVWTNS